MRSPRTPALTPILPLDTLKRIGPALNDFLIKKPIPRPSCTRSDRLNVDNEYHGLPKLGSPNLGSYKELRNSPRRDAFEAKRTSAALQRFLKAIAESAHRRRTAPG